MNLGLQRKEEPLSAPENYSFTPTEEYQHVNGAKGNPLLVRLCTCTDRPMTGGGRNDKITLTLDTVRDPKDEPHHVAVSSTGFWMKLHPDVSGILVTRDKRGGNLLIHYTKPGTTDPVWLE